MKQYKNKFYVNSLKIFQKKYNFQKKNNNKNIIR